VKEVKGKRNLPQGKKKKFQLPPRGTRRRHLFRQGVSGVASSPYELRDTVRSMTEGRRGVQKFSTYAKRDRGGPVLGAGGQKGSSPQKYTSTEVKSGRGEEAKKGEVRSSKSRKEK